MALKATKPVIAKNRLKLFLYGPAKVGKTTLAIQFPTPYIIDSEGSTDKPKYVRAIEKVGGLVLMTQDFDEIVEEVKELMRGGHAYKTLVIDSFTVIYNNLVEKMAAQLAKVSKDKDSDGTEFGRHISAADKRIKSFMNLLFAIDMNVIVTAHAKVQYGDKMTVLGQTFDGYKKLDYLFDLILELQKRGKSRVAIVKGSRLDEFEEDETYDASYAEFSKRYSAEIMERIAVPVDIATAEQVDKLKQLIQLYKEPEETVQKWLDKAKVDALEDLTKPIIEKLITHMEDKTKAIIGQNNQLNGVKH